jgi:outer membrane biosynthesis protein TonB
MCSSFYLVNSHSDIFLLSAWAHLILYGEEATKKAQQEGEEAAAAWEQLQKDIAEGRVSPSALSSPKKKKKNPPGAPRGPRGPRGPRKPASNPAPTASTLVETPSNDDVKQEQTKEQTEKPTAVNQAKETQKVKEDTEAKSQKEVEPQPATEEAKPQPQTEVAKPNPVERESTYISMYSKKEVPKTLSEWSKLKTSCAMMLSSGTKGTSKVSAWVNE